MKKNIFFGNIKKNILDDKLLNCKFEIFLYQVLDRISLRKNKPETMIELVNEYLFYNGISLTDGLPMKPDMVELKIRLSEFKLK